MPFQHHLDLSVEEPVRQKQPTRITTLISPKSKPKRPHNLTHLSVFGYGQIDIGRTRQRSILPTATGPGRVAKIKTYLFGFTSRRNRFLRLVFRKIKREITCFRFRTSILPTFLLSWILLTALAPAVDAQNDPKKKSAEEAFLSGVRQLTFEGRRAGEGYFSADGSKLVFQSERREDNPFFQIYLLDFETGDVEPISPGNGKTTCAWVHPDNNQVLFASTQDDPQSRAKQKQEIEFRESGQSRRYS